MRVLLINSNLKDDILAAPPVGLCYVASAAQTAGHDVKVRDLCFEKNIGVALKEDIRGFSPEVVGISVRNIDNVNLLNPVSYLEEVKEIVQRVRALTAVPIVIGGSGASLCPEHMLSHLEADFIIVSDGEIPFVELLSALERDEHPADIPGVGVMRDTRFYLCPPQLEDFPSGNAKLGSWVDMKRYEKMGGSYNIQTKRGCNQRCIYCTYGSLLEGRRYRLRSPVEVVDEIEEAIHLYKGTIFEFVDSVFNEPLDHCVEILEEIVRRPWKARFTAMGVTPRNLDRALLDLMWKAGFASYMMTPESASETMIKNYGKGFEVEDLVRSVEAIEKTRFTVMWYFLIGGPGETNQTLEETLQFARKYLYRKTRPPYNIANFYLGVRIYPGTRLWEIAVDDGFVTPDSYPLQQLWYLSDELDLGLALKQLTDEASKAPEVMLGFDERQLVVSNIVSWLADLVRIPKPFWRHLWGANQILLKTGLRWITRPRDLEEAITRRLAEQRRFVPSRQTRQVS